MAVVHRIAKIEIVGHMKVDVAIVVIAYLLWKDCNGRDNSQTM